MYQNKAHVHVLLSILQVWHNKYDYSEYYFWLWSSKTFEPTQEIKLLSVSWFSCSRLQIFHFLVNIMFNSTIETNIKTYSIIFDPILVLFLCRIPIFFIVFAILVVLEENNTSTQKYLHRVVPEKWFATCE